MRSLSVLIESWRFWRAKRSILKPAPFDYIAPQTVDEALAALRQNVPDARILAGGQSLLPLLNLRLTQPKILIDLNGIPTLEGIHQSAGDLIIGAMTRQSKVERSSLVQLKCPILVAALRQVGHVAIRHRGTIGGSLVHADPAAELPAVTLALDAQFEVIRDRESRTIAAEKFFIDYLTTALGPDEILQKIVFPVLRPSSGYAVEEIVRRHGDFAVAGVAAAVTLDEAGRIDAARIALFGVAPTAVRVRAVEAALKDQTPTAGTIRDAAALLDDLLEPPSDVHGSSAYRKHVSTILAVRALTKAVQQCHERRLT
jgi:CO/xanthine dehydrogenase FAD-binding subunit